MREITKDWKGVAMNSRWIHRWRFEMRSKREEVLRRKFLEGFRENPKEFETYSYKKVEKGFASPLR